MSEEKDTQGTQDETSAQANESQAQTNDTASESCDSSCSSCGVSDCGERSAPAKLDTLEGAHIKHVIAVVSGKGGVGKSLVTTQLAAQLSRKGYKVGVLDADITGPTMARAFGFDGILGANETGIVPLETEGGIKVVSTNMILPDETTPVLWRGAIISNLIRQFFSEVHWGELDYLLIDMPPGTGDVALTVYQSLPIDGIVIVTAPQDLVSMIVGKAINMANMMDVPVLGIVENMSYFECPDCNSKHKIFGNSDIDAIASEYKIPLTAALPINPSFAERMDKGEAAEIDISEFSGFVDAMLLEVPEQQ